MSTIISTDAITLPIHEDDPTDIFTQATINNLITPTTKKYDEVLYTTALRSATFRLNRVNRLARDLNILTRFKEEQSGFIYSNYYNQTSPSVAIPLRRDTVNYLDDTNVQKNNVQRTVDTLKVPAREVVEQISTNPNIDSIDDVFLVHATNLVGHTKEEREYTYELFKKLYQLDNVGSQAVFESKMQHNLGTNWTFNNVIELNYYLNNMLPQGINIKEGEYNSNLKYGWVEQEEVVHITPNIHPWTGIVLPNDYVEYLQAGDDYSINVTYGNSTVKFKAPLNRITKITSTKRVTYTVYNMIIVHEVELANGDIQSNAITLPKGTSVGVSSYPSQYSKIYTNTDSARFSLCTEILDNLHLRVAEKIVYKSQALTIYSIQTVHLEWYQEPEFAAFLQIIAVVITVISLGTLFEVGLSLNTIAISILTIATVDVIGDFIIEWAIENLDEDAAIAIAIFVGLASAATGDGFNTGKIFKDVMKVISAITEALNKLTKFELEQIQEDYDEFEEYLNPAMDELERRQEQLERDKLDISGALLFGSIYYDELDVRSSESPQNYYKRVLQTDPIKLLQDQLKVDPFFELPEPEGI